MIEIRIRIGIGDDAISNGCRCCVLRVVGVVIGAGDSPNGNVHRFIFGPLVDSYNVYILYLWRLLWLLKFEYRDC